MIYSCPLLIYTVIAYKINWKKQNMFFLGRGMQFAINWQVNLMNSFHTVSSFLSKHLTSAKLKKNKIKIPIGHNESMRKLCRERISWDSILVQTTIRYQLLVQWTKPLSLKWAQSKFRIFILIQRGSTVKKWPSQH